MGKNSGKWAAGALAAGAIGYIAGVLTAPKSGIETRKDLKNAATKAKSDAEKKLKVMLAELNAKLDVAKKNGSNFKGKAKIDLNKVVSKATAAKEKVREVLSALHDGDAEDPELKQALKDAKDAIKHLQKFVKD
jgi:gas vesicle protein